MSLWNDPELRKLFLNHTPLIDVRAPVEFAEGSIPGSVNLPIMNNEERHAVGTCYKQEGQAAAIQLGQNLVSGEIKISRIEGWKKFISQNPEAQLFCFRGGLRSQTACQWLHENGVERHPISGGYKRMRAFFLSYLEEGPPPQMVRLGGLTGSGKTRFLQQLLSQIDIEKLANHRGSSFGNNGPQPAQITFENQLALECMKKENHTFVVEDESATLGRIFIPKRFFGLLRASPLIILEVPHEERIKNIFEDYVKFSSVDFFISAVARIEKRLGQSKCHSLKAEIVGAFNHGMEINYHEGWINRLLEEYYDPLYQKDLRNNQNLIKFKGTLEDVLEFLGSPQY